MTYIVFPFNEVQKLFCVACEDGSTGTILLVCQVLEVLERMSNVIMHS